LSVPHLITPHYPKPPAAAGFNRFLGTGFTSCSAQECLDLLSVGPPHPPTQPRKTDAARHQGKGGAEVEHVGACGSMSIQIRDVVRQSEEQEGANPHADEHQREGRELEPPVESTSIGRYHAHKARGKVIPPPRPYATNPDFVLCDLTDKSVSEQLLPG